MKKICRTGTFFFLFFTVILCFCGCSRQAMQHTRYTPGQTNVLIPEAGGKETVSVGPLTLDFSNKSQGYFTASLADKPDAPKIHIQLTGPDHIAYKYFFELPGETAVFPFTAGSGAYVVLAYENIGGDQYTALLSHSLSVELENEFLPFLYPNQYVNFSADSPAISLAAKLSAEAETDLDALTAIYQYITQNIAYDDEKAASVPPGYLPDIDETLESRIGICFDYASLTAAMLRSLSIPTRLEIGYSGDVRHAWVDVYIESMGWVENAIEFNGSEWNLMDPTFASAIDNAELLQDMIGDGSSYSLLYVR